MLERFEIQSTKKKDALIDCEEGKSFGFYIEWRRCVYFLRRHRVLLLVRDNDQFIFEWCDVVCAYKWEKYWTRID